MKSNKSYPSLVFGQLCVKNLDLTEGVFLHAWFMDTEKTETETVGDMWTYQFNVMFLLLVTLLYLLSIPARSRS